MGCDFQTAPCDPENPPSIVISVDVMYRDSSEARNNTAFATSSASPISPNGTFFSICFSRASPCSGERPRFQRGVRMTPGTTQLTQIRRGASSDASACAIALTAALLAGEAPEPGKPTVALIELFTAIHPLTLNNGDS